VPTISGNEMSLRRTSILAAGPSPPTRATIPCSCFIASPSAGDALLRFYNVPIRLSSHPYCLAHKSPSRRLQQEIEQTPSAPSSLVAPTPYAGEASHAAAARAYTG
jgi:hypothetical protein